MWGGKAELWVQGLRVRGYQCNEVPGVLPPEVPTAAENNEGDEEDSIGNVVRPDILPDEALHLRDEREHGHSGQSHRQLQGQHQEHLRKGPLRACPAPLLPPHPAQPQAHLPDEGLADAFVIPVGGREVLVVIVGRGSLLMIVPVLRC